MDEQKQLVDAMNGFINAYSAATHQLADADTARRWFLLSLQLPEVTPATAAAWARLGYNPGPAEALIRDGITPEQVLEMEQRAEEQAGGPEALAEQRAAELTDSGQLIGPEQIIRVADPFDLDHEVVQVRDQQ